MKSLIISLISLCIGIFLYEYMTDKDYEQAIQNGYWAIFGGLFIYFRKEQ